MDSSVWKVCIGLGVFLTACQQQEAKPAASGQPVVTIGGVNDQLITAAAMVALPPPGISPSDLPDATSAGAKNVAEFCSQCHNIPSPAAHSATDWPSVARRMWLRMELIPASTGIKVPTIQQRQVLLNYLLDNSLKVSGSTLPEGAGRSTFAETCSRCHALPDPHQHSAADWPAVVLRMGQRMDQLKVNRPTPAETQSIVAYLSQVSKQKASSKP